MAGGSGVEKCVVPVEDGVCSLAFCSSQEASNLLAVGGPSKISIKAFHFNVKLLAAPCNAIAYEIIVRFASLCTACCMHSGY